MNILITGAAGFIGTNLVQYLTSRYPSYNFILVDSLTYAANRETYEKFTMLPNVRMFNHDIANNFFIKYLSYSCNKVEKIDAVIHLAAESMVDRSITSATEFIRTNVLGTQNVIDLCRKLDARLIHFSTDEVHGEAESDKWYKQYFHESFPIQPRNPYAASKAGAELLVRAAQITHGLNAVILRPSNNYGSHQHREKMIPKIILNALQDKPIPVYGDGLNIRDWLHVEDTCRAVDTILHATNDTTPVYCIGAWEERTNLEVVHTILDILEKPRSLIQFVEDRKGHDRRYAIAPSLIKDHLGWESQIEFTEGIKKTIDWYKANSAV